MEYIKGYPTQCGVLEKIPGENDIQFEFHRMDRS